jgi:hypothetical protein
MKHHHNGGVHPMLEIQRLKLRLKTLSFLEWKMVTNVAKLEQLRNEANENDGYETKQFGTA